MLKYSLHYNLLLKTPPTIGKGPLKSIFTKNKKRKIFCLIYRAPLVVPLWFTIQFSDQLISFCHFATKHFT